MTNAKQPDALRLSGLHNPLNILNFKDFVDLVRRSHGIRHEQSALCLSHAGTWRCRYKDKTSYRRFLRVNQVLRHYFEFIPLPDTRLRQFASVLRDRFR
ncbi:hypothetical protein BTQ07_13765 [Escherichia coli]|nr:hypothetical protein BTQ07_13765 [Escherichia coli]